MKFLGFKPNRFQMFARKVLNRGRLTCLTNSFSERKKQRALIYFINKEDVCSSFLRGNIKAYPTLLKEIY